MDEVVGGGDGEEEVELDDGELREEEDDVELGKPVNVVRVLLASPT